MQLHKIYIALLFFCIFLTSCRSDKKEEQLAHREQVVAEREKEFAIKEADYNSLLRMRDSLLTKKDTVIIQQWPEALAGIWNSRSVCRESNCGDYVIGDQRTNVWEFISDSTGLLTRVTDKNNNLIRMYNGQYDSTGINLQFVSDSSSGKKINLNVDLGIVSPELLKGMQTIRADKSCTAKFSVELTRSINR